MDTSDVNLDFSPDIEASNALRAAIEKSGIQSIFAKCFVEWAKPVSTQHVLDWRCHSAFFYSSFIRRLQEHFTFISQFSSLHAANQYAKENDHFLLQADLSIYPELLGMPAYSDAANTMMQIVAQRAIIESTLARHLAHLDSSWHQDELPTIRQAIFNGAKGGKLTSAEMEKWNLDPKKFPLYSKPTYEKFYMIRFAQWHLSRIHRTAETKSEQINSLYLTFLFGTSRQQVKDKFRGYSDNLTEDILDDVEAVTQSQLGTAENCNLTRQLLDKLKVVCQKHGEALRASWASSEEFLQVKAANQRQINIKAQLNDTTV
jgi:hypothetical protein